MHDTWSLNEFFLCLFAEHDFSIYSASNIAASSIAASLSGLNWHVKSRISIYDLVDKLAELSDSESVSWNDFYAMCWHNFSLTDFLW